MLEGDSIVFTSFSGRAERIDLRVWIMVWLKGNSGLDEEPLIGDTRDSCKH
jgi:hypothetical protein